MTTPSTLQRGTGRTGDRRTVPLTQLVHLMAEYQKLGAHRQTFLPAPMSGDTFVRACGLVAGGLAIVAGICATAAWWAGSVVFGVLALTPLLAAGLRGRLTGHSRRARLDLFHYGLTVYRPGQQIVAFRWDTVEVCQEAIPSRNSAAVMEHSFVLSGPGGVREAFDEGQFAGAHEWGPAVQSAVTATQLPPAVEAIDAGETVRFGEIEVNLVDLTYAGSSYPWEQVQQVDAHGGMVRIKSDGRWISLPPVESIPNFYIFNEVAERLRMAAAAELAAEADVEPTDRPPTESESAEPRDTEARYTGPVAAGKRSGIAAAVVESAVYTAEPGPEQTAQLSTSSSDPGSA